MKQIKFNLCVIVLLLLSSSSIYKAQVSLMGPVAPINCGGALPINTNTNGTTYSQTNTSGWFTFTAGSNDMIINISPVDLTFGNIDSLIVTSSNCSNPIVISSYGKRLPTDTVSAMELRILNLTPNSAYNIYIVTNAGTSVNYNLKAYSVVSTACDFMTNGNFENYGGSCPNSTTLGSPPLGTYLLPNWATGSPDGTSDAWNNCSSGNNNPSANGLVPHSGNGCAGLYVFALDYNNNPYPCYYEYLKSSYPALTATKKYYVQMFYAKRSQSRLATDGLGIYLSNGQPTNSSVNNIVISGNSYGCPRVITPILNPQVSNPSGNIMSNTNWLPMSSVYTASGGENNILIGNFKYETNTQYATVNPSGGVAPAYYFIDDVSITPLEISIASGTICNGLSTQLNPVLCTPPYCTSSYVWSPSTGLNNPNILNPTASPNVTTTYTLTQTITNAVGAVTTSTAQTTITVLSTFGGVNVSASTYTICAGNNVSLFANSTNPAITFYWYPVGVGGGNISVTPNATTIYTVVSQIPSSGGDTGNGGTCVSTNTVLINVNTLSITPSISSNSVCSGNTVTLSATSNSVGTTYVWYSPSSTNYGSPITVNPTTSTSYTVIGTSVAGCTAQTVNNLYVFSNTPTFTFTVSDPFVCPASYTSNISVNNGIGSGNLFTLTAQGYTASAFNNIIISPTITTVYTIYVNNLNGCPTTQTFQVGVVSCACFGAYYNFSNGGGVLPPNTTGILTNDINLGGGVLNITHDEVIIYPNVQITVYPTATLNILGSHLYACGDMWNGIKVLPGGQLNILALGARNGTTTLIEDAKIAVDIPQNSTYTNTPNILTVKYATFNKNNVSIKITGYNANQATYPFTIENTLFTSRNIFYSGLFWFNTNLVKGSPSLNSSPMATPYINNTLYPTTGMVSPYAGLYPAMGMSLTNVGVITTSTSIFRGIAIGSPTNNFNCFDNLRIDINAKNTNFTVVNTIFQNGQRYGGRGGLTNGGQAIIALSTSIPDMVSNNQVNIVSGLSNGTFNNKFYEKTSCADITGYISTNIKYNEAYSIANTYTAFAGTNTYGNRGFNVKTNRYFNINVENNSIYNIKNSVLIALDNGFYDLNSQAGAGRLVGYIEAKNNLINRYIGIPTNGEYVNIGISIADPFASAPTNFIPGNSVYVNASNNTINNVHNGIDVKNISFCPVSMVTNSITMVNEPNTIVSNPIQIGINAVQLQKLVNILQNNISGATSYSAGVKAISTSLNTLLSVRCNTTAQTNSGLEFNNGQTIDFIEDNLMQNQKYGFVLDNNAVLTNATSSLNVIGTNIRPTNNVWNGVWTAPNYKTATLGFSSAQNGKLYIQYGNITLDPNTSGYTTGNNLTDRYNYTVVSPITLLSSTPITPSCRIGGGGTGAGAVGARTVLEPMVTNSVSYIANVIETQVINKIMAYRSLKLTPTIMVGSTVLNNFYTTAQTTNLQKAISIEQNLMADSNSLAQSKITSFSPSNAIETNYKNFYNIHNKTKGSSYNSADSLGLISLANMCPYVDGAVVYQARALYNTIYDGYFKFTNSCTTASGSRLLNNSNNTVDENTNTINVILKSKLYPNPNSGLFTIELTNQQSGNVDISVIDITGKQILSEQKVIINNTISVDYNLMNGMYLVKVKLQDGSIDVHRLVISK